MMILISKENIWKKDYFLTKIEIRKIIREIKNYLEKNNLEILKKCNHEIGIRFVCDKTIKDYNNQYRGKNNSTNTLSFTIEDYGLNIQYLGDILFAFETIKQEVIDQNKKFKNHLIHLFIHSYLHLLGFDHIEKKEREIMEEIEIEICKRLNIVNPYLC